MVPTNSTHNKTSWRMLPTLLVCVGCALSACSTTETLENFTSSTSPGSFTQDGIVAIDQKVKLFATFELENLQADMARGEGDYLTSFADLLHVPAERQAQLGHVTQEQYVNLFPTDRTSSGEMMAVLRQKLAVLR